MATLLNVSLLCTTQLTSLPYRVDRGDVNREKPQGVHQEMPLAPFDICSRLGILARPFPLGRMQDLEDKVPQPAQLDAQVPTLARGLLCPAPRDLAAGPEAVRIPAASRNRAGG